MYNEDLALNNQQWLLYNQTKPNQTIHLLYMFKEDLTLNTLQGLICHKTQPNKTKKQTNKKKKQDMICSISDYNYLEISFIIIFLKILF